MVIKLNNILLPLLMTIGVNFLYSYIIYAFFPLLTNFRSVYWESIKSTFIPLYLIFFLSLSLSLWVLVTIPLFLILILISKKLNLNKKNILSIKRSEFNPVIEEWISKQNVMRINNYSVDIEIEKSQTKATVYLFVSNDLDYDEINNLEKRLPDNTIVRIKKTQKKNLGENEYLLT